MTRGRYISGNMLLITPVDCCRCDFAAAAAAAVPSASFSPSAVQYVDDEPFLF